MSYSVLLLNPPIANWWFFYHPKNHRWCLWSGKYSPKYLGQQSQGTRDSIPNMLLFNKMGIWRQTLNLLIPGLLFSLLPYYFCNTTHLFSFLANSLSNFLLVFVLFLIFQVSWSNFLVSNEYYFLECASQQRIHKDLEILFRRVLLTLSPKAYKPCELLGLPL